MPYDLKFTGDFFQIANFLKSLDEMVHMPHGEVDVTGRLLTVDGFALAPERERGGSKPQRDPDPHRRSLRHHLPHPGRPGDHGRRDPERPGARDADAGHPDARVEHDHDPITAPTSSAPAPTP